MTIEIHLNQGRVALIDDDDLDLVIGLKWYVNTAGYAATQDWATKKSMRMHRLIMAPPAGMDVDHRNRNRLDNRRSNLRICTRSQNLQNQGPRMGSKRAAIHSEFKGVYWIRGKWEVRFWTGQRLIVLGRFLSEVEAAQCFDAAARQYHGEFARLNFPNEVN